MVKALTDGFNQPIPQALEQVRGYYRYLTHKDKIPQPVVATIVHYLLLIVFVGGIAIGVGFLIFLGASKVFEFYTEDYADTMSLAVFLISLAVSVYFAEPIRAVIPINLLLLLILVHIVYVLIRWYVKGCMRSRGYY